MKYIAIAIYKLNKKEMLCMTQPTSIEIQFLQPMTHYYGCLALTMSVTVPHALHKSIIFAQRIINIIKCIVNP